MGMNDSEFCRCRFDSKTGKRVRCPRHLKTIHLPKRPDYIAQPPQAILEYGKSIQDPLAQALIFFAYLTGGRINECTDFMPARITYHEDRIVIRMKTEKDRGKGDNQRKVPIPKEPVGKCLEAEMWGYVEPFIMGYEAHKKPFAKWKNMSDYLKKKAPTITIEARIPSPAGWKDAVITKPIHPHYLRHCRATHLEDFYGFTDPQLCAFFGWKKADMPRRYTKSSDAWNAFRQRK